MENGLPGNNVYALRQTQDGYLWIGTQDGLVRFDGLNFELFTKENIFPLKDNEIRALCEDRSGVLWLGTNSGGLARYKEGEFTAYPIEKYNAFDRISAIAEDRWGNLWIGSLTEGLTCLSRGKFTTYTTATKGKLPHNRVMSLYKDGNGDLWVVTGAGILKLLKPGIFQNYPSQDHLPHPKTACLYKAETGELWIGTGDSGLYCWKNGTFTGYEAAAGFPHRIVTYLYEDKEKNLWIGTADGSLTRMSNGIFSTLPFGDELAAGYVSSIYEDREGSLWVGVLDKGLYQLRDSKFTTTTTTEGLVHNDILCTYEDRAGNLWIGTVKGLNRLELKKRPKETGAPVTVLTGRQGLLNEFVVCLFEDPAGYLWIGTGAGLHRFKDGKLTTLTTKDGLSDSRIGCILGDSRGNTWVGTENGLNRFSAATGRFTVFTRNEGLLSNAIGFIYEDSRGQLWIGTDSGLNCLNDGIITAPQPGPGMTHYSFRCAYEDNEGTFWFGTTSGLIRFRDNQTTLYTVKCGLLENDVRGILEDEIGYIWLAGRNGISRVSKKVLEDFSGGKIPRVQPGFYNEKDGMKSRWCNGAGCKTRDGRFWFPTTVGVAMIDPNHIKEDILSPTTTLEQVIVDGVSIEPHVKGKGAPPLELEPGKKWLGFNYRGISFINPQRIQFKVRLAGRNGNWVEMGTVRNTTYTDLPPGFYTFSVTSRNPGGTWDEEGASFSFYLKPYFYQTTWFYLLAVLSVLFLGFLVFRLRVRQLKTREKELTQLVELRTRDLKERTVELEKAHHELRESNEIIKAKNRHIMDSMRYARKIQQAMLPMREKMEKELKEYFVIYKPKDIVSGDFYWFDVIDGQYFLAVADCTGHGVPGALLSMIGFMMLKDVVTEKRILEPSQVLSHLHQGFRSVLKQEIGESDTYDGMDMGLCRIDLDRGKIVFAGAHRPLYFIRSPGSSELIEIKGNRKSIGGRQREEMRRFDSREVDIFDDKQNGIMLYLTTDGFADQQNPQNQKYGSRRLKKFFQENAHLSAVQQQVIFEELKKHRGNEEQRDDITIIGIRIR